MSFGVSVIIPVYNAENYISQAVNSAAGLPEVREVLVVDDGSTDDSVSICKQIAKENGKIKVLGHPDGKNHGRSASRNLGINKASSEYIAFLDADDFYLPERFVSDARIFSEQPDIDGIYGATSAIFEDQESRDLFFRRFDAEVSTFKMEIAPDALAGALLFGGEGHFTTDAITLRKKLFNKTGYFSEKLDQGEDSHLWIRAALCGRLMAGSIGSPVAVRRVHRENSIHTGEHQQRLERVVITRSVFLWSLNKKYLSFDSKNDCFLAFHQAWKQHSGKNTSCLCFLACFLAGHPVLLLRSFLYRKLKQLVAG